MCAEKGFSLLLQGGDGRGCDGRGLSKLTCSVGSLDLVDLFCSLFSSRLNWCFEDLWVDLVEAFCNHAI